jgi:hypothetical protein
MTSSIIGGPRTSCGKGKNDPTAGLLSHKVHFGCSCPHLWDVIKRPTVQRPRRTLLDVTDGDGPAQRRDVKHTAGVVKADANQPTASCHGVRSMPGGTVPLIRECPDDPHMHASDDGLIAAADDETSGVTQHKSPPALRRNALARTGVQACWHVLAYGAWRHPQASVSRISLARRC